LARPKPTAPSPRVYAAFGVAAIIGIAIFLIWWLTTDARLRRGVEISGTGAGEFLSPPEATSAPDPEAMMEPALPRGGSLRGWTDAMGRASGRLTAAPLVRVNRSTDQPEPWLAESWVASSDNRIYTMKLRPGLVSADGTALTSAGAAERLSALEAAGRPVAVRALDPLTVELRFDAPFAPALRLLDRYPLPGFGPFVEDTSVSTGSSPRTYRRNPHYWRKAADGSLLPYLDEIVLAPGPGGPGQPDFADSAITADEFEEMKKLEQSGKARLFDLGPGLDADALWFAPAAPPSRDKPPATEHDRPWLTSETLRLAISAAVDRREYCKQVFYGACDPMAGPVSPANVAWFNPDFPLGQGNPELARAMLAELGLRDRSGNGIFDDAARRPLRFTLLIRRDVPSSARAASFLAGTLKEIGVLIDVTPLSADALAERRRKGAYDAIYDRIEVPDTDPAMNLDFWLSSGAAHVWNSAPLDPERDRRGAADWERQIDQLMEKLAASFDRTERLQAFVDAQKIYLQHLPAIFFGVPHVRIATSIRTLNATPSLLRPHLLWNAEGLSALP
jgi:peptide/nickel transport system substrate-binding protein